MLSHCEVRLGRQQYKRQEQLTTLRQISQPYACQRRQAHWHYGTFVANMLTAVAMEETRTRRGYAFGGRGGMIMARFAGHSPLDTQSRWYMFKGRFPKDGL